MLDLERLKKSLCLWRPLGRKEKEYFSFQLCYSSSRKAQTVDCMLSPLASRVLHEIHLLTPLNKRSSMRYIKAMFPCHEFPGAQ